MKRYNIGPLKKLLQLRITAFLSLKLRSFMRSVGQHIHAEGIGQPSHGLSDTAEADNSHGLSRQFNQRRIPETEIRTGAPAPLIYRLAVMSRMMANLQQQGKGKLRYRVRSVGRNVAHRDSMLLSRLNIRHIIAC